MRNLILALSFASMAVSAAPLLAQPGHSKQQQSNDRDRHDGRQNVRQIDRRQYRNYDYNRPDPRYGNYRADRYYVAGNQYQPRRLDRNERIYRGTDNRYYCRRSDGTTGLIIGGITGGVLGNSIAAGGSKTLGTLLGGSIGALLGQSVDRGQVTCR